MNDIVLTILSISLSGSALALLLFVMKPLLKNRVSKAFSYYLWLPVLLRLAIPFGYGISLPEFVFTSGVGTAGSIISAGGSEYNTTDGRQTLPSQPLVIPDASAPANDVAGINGENTGDLPSPGEAPANTQGLWELIKENLFSIWLFDTIISTCWYTAAYTVFSRRIRRSCVTPHGDDAVVFETMRGGKNVRLACNSYANTPMLMGEIL